MAPPLSLAPLSLDNPCYATMSPPTSPLVAAGETHISPPSTPTEGAWWALLEDCTPRGGTTPTTKSQPHVASSSSSCIDLWEIILRDEEDLTPLAREGDEYDDETDEDEAIREKGSFSSYEDDYFTPTASVAQESNSGLLLLKLFQCGGVDLETRFEKLPESPCATILNDVRKFTFTREDPEYEDIFELSSTDEEGVGTGTAAVVETVWEEQDERYNNVFEELEDEISFLRDRTEAIKMASFKYKSMTSRREIARLATLKAKEEASLTSNKKKAKRRVAFLDEGDFNPNNEQPPITLVANTLGQQVQVALDKEKPNDNEKTCDRAPPTVELSQIFDVASADHDADKETPPPVRVVDPIMNERPEKFGDCLLQGMSTLTQESLGFGEERSGANRLQQAKLAMTPNILKKLQKLKTLRMTRRSNSSGGTSNGSMVSGPSLSHSFINTIVSGRKKAPYQYENNPKVNSYAAYFRRGGKADQTVRIYDHVTPSVFPTGEGEMVVKIEASTVSVTDCKVRKGEFWGEGSDKSLNLPIVPGVTFVGTIIQIPKTGCRTGTGLQLGDRVVSLVHSGGNARHICIGADKLVKVPDVVQNIAGAACLPELYLSAFQALHLGQRNGCRYRKSSLSGKCVLVLGGATAFGQAVIEVALAGGCTSVYATGKEKQYDVIRAIGGAPLGRDPKQWSSILVSRIDTIIGIDDSIGQSELSQDHMSLLRPLDGRIVLFSAPEHDDGSVINLDEQTCATASTSGRKIFQHNVFEAWDEDVKQSRRDLAHLLKLLGDGVLMPKILERIPLNRVAKAHDVMEGKKLNGFIVCEPWIKGRMVEERDGPNTTRSQSDETREAIENIPHTPSKPPQTTTAAHYSPLALFGGPGFWKAISEPNRWNGVSHGPADPNQTPTAANLKRRSHPNEKPQLRSVIQN